METQVEFPKFIQALKDLGAAVAGAPFLQDASAAWSDLPEEVRAGYLRSLGMADAPLEIRIAKKPGAKAKSLANVLVILKGEPRPEAPVEAAQEEEEEDEPIETLVDPAPQIEAEPQAPPAETEPARPHDPASLPVVVDEGPAPLVEAVEAPKPALVPDAPKPAEAPAGPTAMVVAEGKDKKGLRSLFAFGKKAEPAAAWTGPVTELAQPKEGMTVVEVYPVQEPYAFIRILMDNEKHEYRYEIVEPGLTEREKNILDFIESTIVDVIEVGLSAMTKEQAADLLKKHFDEVVYDYSIVLTPLAREKVLYYILRDFLGFGKLDPIMRDDLIEDVSCDGPKIPIFLYHRKYESIKSLTAFDGDVELDSFVIKMAQRSGKHVSIAEPLLDATLPDGSRLNATLSDEVTDGGSTFTIRKFREDPFTIPDLVKFGTMNEDLLAYWWLAVQNGASAIYAGGTASGKTTSLNAILLFIPPQMKIVSIEDTRELNIPHENWIAGVTRSGFGPRDNNGRQAGEIDMFSLLKAALRQRPEYILVGEVRGQEATALFQAMATGHTAYGTMHADSAEAVIHRLESDPISIPRSLLEALDIVSIQIQTRIGDRRVRRTKELVEIVGLDPHTREILTNEVFSWSPANDKFEFSGVSYVLERIQIERNMNESDMREEFERRKRVIRWMVKNNLRALDDVGRIISTYYRDRDKIMALVDEDLKKDDVKEVLVKVAGPAKAPAPRSLALQVTEEEEGFPTVAFPGEEEHDGP